MTVTFNSNDGNPASNLAITGGLSPLPSGWSGPGTFTCASVNTAGKFLPTQPDLQPHRRRRSGTLQLNYSYKANSGTAKTGSVTHPLHRDHAQQSWS